MSQIIRETWRHARTVCFDVDSTVSPDEGIDVLADIAGVGPQVAALTGSAMGGSMTFQEALRRRLDLIRPSRALLAECLRRHPPRLVPGIAALVAALHGRGVAVHLVSGGFEPLVLPLAEMLKIPVKNVHANAFVHAADGSFGGFAADRPTARRGGKADVLAKLRSQPGSAPLVMVGDGATDLESRPAADGFIGFGGVVVREKVKAGADWFVTDFAELLTALDGPASAAS
ncbi:phosphoserine phosphatase [Planctomycetota bacterium]|nr:phosphoserine phosphatase [Planctomycetota bacterium]